MPATSHDPHITDPARGRWRASPDVVATALGDELAFLDFLSNAYFTVNRTGADVWALLQEGVDTLDDIAAGVAARYGIAPAECRDDVAELLVEMRRNGLVTYEEADGTADGTGA